MFLFFLFKFPKMPLKYNYVTASSFIPLRHLPFLEIYSWSSVCFVTQSFESGEHSTAPKAPDGWREVYIASWSKYTSSLTPALRPVFDTAHFRVSYLLKWTEAFVSDIWNILNIKFGEIFCLHTEKTDAFFFITSL